MSLRLGRGARNWGSILECITPGVTEDMNRDLLEPVFDKEVMAATLKIRGLRAPGPDGFQGIFY